MGFDGASPGKSLGSSLGRRGLGWLIPAIPRFSPALFSCKIQLRRFRSLPVCAGEVTKEWWQPGVTLGTSRRPSWGSQLFPNTWELLGILVAPSSCFPGFWRFGNNWRVAAAPDRQGRGLGVDPDIPAPGMPRDGRHPAVTWEISCREKTWV